MATWDEFAEAEPDMSALGLRLLDTFHLAYLATVRADGAPRVHPVAPFIIDGRIIVATPRSSPKARDQLRDGRYALHFLPGKDDDEFRIRGRAKEAVDPALRDRILSEGPHYAHAEDYLFEYDIAEAVTAYWVNVGQPGTYPVRRSWRDRRAPR